MVRPNVNLKLKNIMDGEISRVYNQNLLDVGSCRLHVINGAFKDGSVKSRWLIQNLLLSLYRLFKDTPARQEDYISVTGSEKLPLKFCAHRCFKGIFQWLNVL